MGREFEILILLLRGPCCDASQGDRDKRIQMMFTPKHFLDKLDFLIPEFFRLSRLDICDTSLSITECFKLKKSSRYMRRRWRDCEKSIEATMQSRRCIQTTNFHRRVWRRKVYLEAIRNFFKLNNFFLLDTFDQIFKNSSHFSAWPLLTPRPHSCRKKNTIIVYLHRLS